MLGMVVLFKYLTIWQLIVVSHRFSFLFTGYQGNGPAPPISLNEAVVAWSASLVLSRNTSALSDDLLILVLALIILIIITFTFYFNT